MIMGWGFKINPKSKIDLKIEKEDGDIIKYKTKFIKKYQLNHTGMIKNLSLIWVQNSKSYLRFKLGIKNRRRRKLEKKWKEFWPKWAAALISAQPGFPLRVGRPSCTLSPFACTTGRRASHQTSRVGIFFCALDPAAWAPHVGCSPCRSSRSVCFAAPPRTTRWPNELRYGRKGGYNRSAATAGRDSFALFSHKLAGPVDPLPLPSRKERERESSGAGGSRPRFFNTRGPAVFFAQWTSSSASPCWAPGPRHRCSRTQRRAAGRRSRLLCASSSGKKHTTVFVRCLSTHSVDPGEAIGCASVRIWGHPAGGAVSPEHAQAAKDAVEKTTPLPSIPGWTAMMG
jgi:hypothetical protein